MLLAVSGNTNDCDSNDIKIEDGSDIVSKVVLITGAGSVCVERVVKRWELVML
jgi:hypothetical protein